MDKDLDRIYHGRYATWGTGPRSLYELAGKTYFKMRFYESFEETLDILHPKLVEECIRDIAEERSEDLPLRPVLYCKSHGGFGFSDSFMTFVGFDDCRQDLIDEEKFDSWARLDMLHERMRYMYDAVVTFGNFFLDRAPEFLERYNKVKKGLPKDEWNKNAGELTTLWRIDPEQRREAICKREQQYREADKLYKEQFQLEMIALIRQEPDFSPWECTRPVSTKVEEAGLKLASGVYCRLAVSWVPALAPYRINDYDGAESIEW